MVVKELVYKGRNADELKRMSMPEIFSLVGSDARRKLKRMGEDERKLIAKIEKSSKPVKTHLRDMVILPVMIGKIIMVYDGKSFIQVAVTEEMIGHKLGEYALTRKRVMHNSPGIGATRSSSSMSVK